MLTKGTASGYVATKAAAGEFPSLRAPKLVRLKAESKGSLSQANPLAKQQKMPLYGLLSKGIKGQPKSQLKRRQDKFKLGLGVRVEAAGGQVKFKGNQATKLLRQRLKPRTFRVSYRLTSSRNGPGFTRSKGTQSQLSHSLSSGRTILSLRVANA